MRWIHAVAAAVAATGLATSVAKATLTVSLVQIPITSQAVAADSNLTGARAFDLRVTQTGERWNVTTMQFALGSGGGLSGSLYQSPGALISHGAHVFQPSFNNTTPQFYDTSWNVTMNDAARNDILGDSDFPAAGSGTTAVQSGTNVSVAWGDHNGDTNNTATTGGSFSIGRITVKGNTGAFLNGYVAGNVNLNQKQAFSNIYLPILGDTDGDHIVGLSDLNTVEGHLGTNGALAQGDIDGDGIVGLSDLNFVEGNLGNQLAGPTSALGTLVPEPGSLVLVGLLGLAGFGRRGRRVSI